MNAALLASPESVFRVASNLPCICINLLNPRVMMKRKAIWLRSRRHFSLLRRFSLWDERERERETKMRRTGVLNIKGWEACNWKYLLAPFVFNSSLAPPPPPPRRHRRQNFHYVRAAPSLHPFAPVTRSLGARPLCGNT